MKRLFPILMGSLCFLWTAHGVQVDYLDGSVELLTTGDVDLASTFATGSLVLSEQTRVDLRMDLNKYDVSYRPNMQFDPFGSEQSLSDTGIASTLSLQHDRDRHQVTATATAYDGFRNYSSMWIDEYYRQQYGSGGIPGVSYETPDPHGWGFVLSERYEVLPASAYVTLSVGYLRDEVAPGYEVADLGTSFELVRSEDVLHTWTGSLEFEGLLNKHMRTRQSLRLTRTTTRELRMTWNGALNIALSQNWISRTAASLAHENPNFEAWSISQTLEYSLSDNWSLSVTARIYEDTGQIESANLVSSAAPALDSRQAYLSLRRSNLDNSSSFSISVGPYLTDYAPTGIGTERFIHLYADRDWWWGRVAFRHSF